MPEPTSDTNPQKPFFINQFVNTVYGLLLGYGFSNSMSQIETQIEGGKSIDVSIPFSVAAVMYIIIVICVYWWDWVDNIGYRVNNTAQEFALDISILMSLGFLFFVFEHPIIFSAMFFLLAALNLLWVYNFRIYEYQTLKTSNKIESWSEFLDKNPRARDIYSGGGTVLRYLADACFSSH
jgi:hypothetical protein